MLSLRRRTVAKLDDVAVPLLRRTETRGTSRASDARPARCEAHAAVFGDTILAKRSGGRGRDALHWPRQRRIRQIGADRNRSTRPGSHRQDEVAGERRVRREPQLITRLRRIQRRLEIVSGATCRTSADDRRCRCTAAVTRRMARDMTRRWQGGCRLEAGSRQPEAGSWKLEAGSCELETGIFSGRPAAVAIYMTAGTPGDASKTRQAARRTAAASPISAVPTSTIAAWSRKPVTGTALRTCCTATAAAASSTLRWLPAPPTAVTPPARNRRTPEKPDTYACRSLSSSSTFSVISS